MYIISHLITIQKEITTWLWLALELKSKWNDNLTSLFNEWDIGYELNEGGCVNKPNKRMRLSIY